MKEKIRTLVENIFASSIDIVIEKCFKVKLDDTNVYRLIRKGQDTLEIDLVHLMKQRKPLLWK
ncbi:MAG: hypothetical protein ABDH59_03095 [Fervidobacterium sp.]